MQGCLGGREEGRGGKWPVNDRLQLSIIMMGWKGGMIFLDHQTEGKQDQSNYWFLWCSNEYCSGPYVYDKANSIFVVPQNPCYDCYIHNFIVLLTNFIKMQLALTQNYIVIAIIIAVQ